MQILGALCMQLTRQHYTGPLAANPAAQPKLANHIMVMYRSICTCIMALCMWGRCTMHVSLTRDGGRDEDEDEETVK